MKKQTGFISSSSSVSISYATSSSSAFAGYTDWQRVVSSTDIDVKDGETFSKLSALKTSVNDTKLVWKTYASTSYQRIEYFLEAVEKINTPYTKTALTDFPLMIFNDSIGKANIYNGFIDVVITFPCKIRLAGVELLNPWVNSYNDETSSYWKYLPSEFIIFKVNDEKINAELNNVTYETDIAKTLEFGNDKPYFRPVHYRNIEVDQNMIFLGRYEANWETLASKKCFFKFNANDPKSINIADSTDSAGTATWECKQLVIRILKTKISEEPITSTNIKAKVKSFIADKEAEFGTTYNNRVPTGIDISDSIFEYLINKDYVNNKVNDDGDFTIIGGSSLWDFKGSAKRSYKRASDVCFTAGLEYKLGGIQLLLSPDIFSISEMKMFNYANTKNNKVFIGEWNKDLQSLEYYGAGTLRISDCIDVSSTNGTSITWKHNFNVPPKYLDAKVYIKFKVDFDSFYAGDVISNLMNSNKEALAMRITGTDVTLNIANGICFTNPETGEFYQFKDGFGIQFDRPGNYDALKAAQAVNAPVLKAQSIIASKIEPIDASKGNAYPFEIYFVVKRLF